ncbi:MAG: LOG family protein [Patescibacteria group bacterium]
MKYKFAVSGAADPGFCEIDAPQKAEEVGREIIRQGGILLTGATSGIPDFSAKGAKEEGGIVIGVSPAASYQHHLKTYKLPIQYYDTIIFTGFDYSGRNLLLTKSADAVIVICGGFGTLNEFTIALEDNKPIGILTGTGGAAEEISNLLINIKDPHRHGAGKVVFSNEPKELVTKLVKLIEQEQEELKISPPAGE